MKVFYQKKFQPIALSQYCLFFILMYVEVPSFFQVTYNNLIINVLHIRYFPPEEEGSLMASRDWLYGAHNAPAGNLILRKVQVIKISKMIESKIGLNG